jgi:hypothetical protein
MISNKYYFLFNKYILALKIFFVRLDYLRFVIEGRRSEYKGEFCLGRNLSEFRFFFNKR